MKNLIKLSLIANIIAIFLSLPQSVHAVSDPLSVPNNKFGIHLIQATPDESSPAASLVNTNGDWGYVTVLIESKDRNQNKWQEFFNDLRRRHLIPIVRLATQPEGDFWKRPYEGEEQAWADFLDNLNWPVKNRYIIIYNEPNHAAEWGNSVDARNYAKVLDKTITALKSKNSDFFVLNAGFDASTPSQPPRYEDEAKFMQMMNDEVPGIFNRLDGWASHSYPNPGFVGSPYSRGRKTVGTWQWELQKLNEFGVTKNLPVFITETGWKHAEGIKNEPYLPSADTVSNYYRAAFEGIWNNSQIAAVTPFLLSYQEEPFDHFSFKKANSPEFYPQYQILLEMPKTSGKPVQENKAQLIKGEIFSSVVAGEVYDVSLTFKNTGQSIWSDAKLMPIIGGAELGIKEIGIPKGRNVEPGKEETFNLKVKAPLSGVYKTSLNLFINGKQFDTKPVDFITQVKPPVILQVKATLKWKKSFAGAYLLSTSGPSGDVTKIVTLDGKGASGPMEARYLLPDYPFDFTLEKRSEESGQMISMYKLETIRQTLSPGINIIDFGELEPIILGNIFHPRTLWKLLPFSK